MYRMSERLPPNEFGPDIPWREYSFLDNPKAAALRESVLIVRNCGGTDAGTGDAGSVCADGSFRGEIRDHTLSVAAGLTDKQLIEVFSSDAAKHYKVLRFADAAKAWGGFAEPEQQVKFKRRIERYGSIWCCVDAHPGHVWYDMFWDQVPHEDRHGKRWKTLWEPTTGP
jgi:arabinosyltransferase